VKPGPSPKPTKLKRLAGNPGHRRLNTAGPEFPVPSRMPSPPDFLGEEAQRVWRKLGKWLLDAGLFTVVDRYAFGMLADACGRFQYATRMERETGGPVLVSADGNLYQNPWRWTADRAWEQMRKLFGEFGLTPAERSRLRVQVEEEEEDFASMLVRLATEE